MSVNERYIREALKLANEAQEDGKRPFAALLVHKDEVVLTAVNTTHINQDVTGHAELNLVSQATRQFSRDYVAECVLYTSTEPCPMCASAIYWSGIKTVVFSCSATRLNELTSRDLVIPCRDIFANGKRPITVIGPVLEAESVAIHQQYWPTLG